MLRTQVVAGLALALVLFVPAARGQSGLKLGEKFEGEVKELGRLTVKVDNGTVLTTESAFVSEVTVSLKAGQSLAVSVTVAGKNRKVALALQAPKGKTFGSDVHCVAGTVFKTTTAQLEHEEVSATGKYKIWIISDQAGDFTLKVTGSSDNELDEKALKTEIEELETKLAELRKKLKALQEKKSK